MATATKPKGAWQVCHESRQIFVTVRMETPEGEEKFVKLPRWLDFVVLHRGEGEVISFLVTRRRGHLAFSDTREEKTGIAGTTGFWHSRRPEKTGPRRILTQTAWIAEVGRLIGPDRAQEIVQSLGI